MTDKHEEEREGKKKKRRRKKKKRKEEEEKKSRKKKKSKKKKRKKKPKNKSKKRKKRRKKKRKKKKKPKKKKKRKKKPEKRKKSKKKKRKKKKPNKKKKRKKKRKRKSKKKEEKTFIDKVKDYMFPSKDYYTNPKKDFNDWLSLGRNEDIKWWGQPTYWILAPEAIFSIAAIVISLVLSIIGLVVTGRFILMFLPIMVSIAATLYWLDDWIKIRYKFYVITNHKVIAKKGLPFVRMSTDKIPYENIDKIENERDTLEEWANKLGIADIENIKITTTGEDEDDLLLKYIPNARQVAEDIATYNQETMVAMTKQDQIEAVAEGVEQADIGE